MGNGILKFCKCRIKKEHKIAFFSAMFLCLLVHLYKFTNTLPNHDSFFNSYTNQDMTISGRWFLAVACGWSSFFDLPWMIAVLCVLYIALTMVIIVSLFNMKNPIAICVSSFLFVAFPSVTETLFFQFTADGYFLAMLLSAASAYLLCKRNRWRDYILGGICLCLSCAIYQAYVSFALLLIFFYHIHIILQTKVDNKYINKKIYQILIVFALSLAVYYIVWKLILLITNQQAVDYQGIDTVGRISLRTIINGLVLSIKNIMLFFLEWNILEHPITIAAVLNLVFLVAFFVGLSVVLWKTRKNRTVWQSIVILICLLLTVPCISIWCFASNDVQYRPMMMYSICVLFIYAVVLFDKFFSSKCSTAVAAFLLLIAFNFTLVANISYFYMHKSYEKSYATGLQMIIRIQDLPDINDATAVAFIGDTLPVVTMGNKHPSESIHLLASVLEEDMLYDHKHAYLFLKEVFLLELPAASSEKIEALESDSTVAEMGIWPSADSVQIINDTVVIKLAEPVVAAEP